MAGSAPDVGVCSCELVASPQAVVERFGAEFVESLGDVAPGAAFLAGDNCGRSRPVKCPGMHVPVTGVALGGGTVKDPRGRVSSGLATAITVHQVTTVTTHRSVSACQWETGRVVLRKSEGRGTK